MKKIGYSLVILCLLFITISCDAPKQSNINNETANEPKEEIKTMKVLINDKEYIVKLENNETAKSFVDYLPKELKMKELNGNEKYIYLDKTFPTNETNPQRINAGDIMLYGNNCLVIFYKSFDTPYSYTKIGHIDNLNDLGSESIIASFNK